VISLQVLPFAELIDWDVIAVVKEVHQVSTLLSVVMMTHEATVAMMAGCQIATQRTMSS
jgi:hypothetical protein